MPVGFLHGILRGYKIRYYETLLGNATAQTVNVTATPVSIRRRRSTNVMNVPLAKEIGDLKPYTNYSVQITAFTIGDGMWTEWHLYTTDQEGAKNYTFKRFRHDETGIQRASFHSP